MEVEERNKCRKGGTVTLMHGEVSGVLSGRLITLVMMVSNESANILVPVSLTSVNCIYGLVRAFFFHFSTSLTSEIYIRLDLLLFLVYLAFIYFFLVGFSPRSFQIRFSRRYWAGITR